MGKQGHAGAHTFLMYGHYPFHNPPFSLTIFKVSYYWNGSVHHRHTVVFFWKFIRFNSICSKTRAWQPQALFTPCNNISSDLIIDPMKWTAETHSFLHLAFWIHLQWLLVIRFHKRFTASVFCCICFFRQKCPVKQETSCTCMDCFKRFKCAVFQQNMYMNGTWDCITSCKNRLLLSLLVKHCY